MSTRISFIFLFIAFSLLRVIGQIPVGTWREHLSWNTAEAVAIAGKKVYCSNGVGLCIYDIPSRNLNKLTKINGLNDAGITAIQYAADLNAVVIGYVNGNLDLITEKNIYNLPYIKSDSKYTNKRINQIYISGKYAYLSCAFGVVAVDLQLRQVRDSYIIGDNGIPVEILAFTEYNGYFYAATAHGLKRADSQSRSLPNFEVWEKVDMPVSESMTIQMVSTNQSLYACDTKQHIFVYNGSQWNSIALPYAVKKIHRLTISGNSLLVSASSAVFVYNTTTGLLQYSISSYNNTPVVAFDATLDSDGACWIADNCQGLVQWKSPTAISFHLPNGPASNHAAALRFKADRLLVVAGGRDEDGQPLNRQGEIHTFNANQWSSIRPQDTHDFTDVDIFGNQPSTYYVTSWGEGLYVFENGTLKTHYTQDNSALVADQSGNIMCGGLLIDDEQKLWVSNDRRSSLFASGQWKALSWQTPLLSMGRFTGDNYGQIWTTHGNSRFGETTKNNGLWVFSKTASEHGQDYAGKLIQPRNGTATVNLCNQIANTPDGVIWVATTEGPLYYDKPDDILKGGDTAGTHPLRTGTDEPNHMYDLLGTENVLSVAIDGAYRKWFGTETAGVFLINEDNAGEVKHFTTDNSPLFSNKIHDIAINDRTGEVFFATKYGIIAYRSDAVSSGENFVNVYAFPNPVRPEYQGEITIAGLIKDADVKITDVAGNLVYQTRTLGGQAVWNGRNQQGRRVASGAYFIFCTNDDGSKTHVTKIFFIH